MKHAIRQKADVFVTADYKYHEFFDADGKIVIADIGHYESEVGTKELLYDFLRENLQYYAIIAFILCIIITNINAFVILITYFAYYLQNIINVFLFFSYSIYSFLICVSHIFLWCTCLIYLLCTP